MSGKQKQPKPPFSRGNTKYIWIIELIFSLLIIADILIGVLVENKIGVIIMSSLILWLMVTTIAFYLANSKIRGGRSKISWLIAFICFPIISHILFFVWASNPFRYAGKIEYLEKSCQFLTYINFDETEAFLADPNFEKIHPGFYKAFKLTNHLINSNLQSNYALQTIESNPLLFSKSLELIDQAEQIIFMSYYIIDQGFWFDQVIAHLQQKAAQGVQIYIIYDWYGSFAKLKKSTVKKLAQIPNIHIAKFRPKSDFVLRYTNNFRSHAKLLLIDNKIGLYGGSNLADEYLNMKKDIYNWADINYLVEGKIVENLALSFVVDWQYYSYIMYDKHPNYYLFDDLIQKGLWLQTPEVNKQPTGYAFYSQTCPDYYPFLLDNQLDILLNSAHQEIKIITPYFLPTSSLMNAIQSVLNSGVKLSFILPGRPDNKRLMLNINRSYYLELLRMGCKIYEYPGFIHAKMVILDNQVSSVGTFNFDLRSLLINFESAIWFHDQTVTKNLNQTFDDLVKICHVVDEDYLNQVYRFKQKFQVYFSQIFAGLL